jgi:hypothetical protein
MDFQQKLQILTRNVNVGHSQHVWPILMQLDLRHSTGERRTLRVGLFEPKFMRYHSSPNEYYQQVSKTAFKLHKGQIQFSISRPVCLLFAGVSKSLGQICRSLSVYFSFYTIFCLIQHCSESLSWFSAMEPRPLESPQFHPLYCWH